MLGRMDAEIGLGHVKKRDQWLRDTEPVES